jgi:FMN-dependent NADH-azoreductase
MTTLLHIDSSIQGEGSVTRELTKAIVADLRSKRPDLQVHYVNLAAQPLTHLTLDLLPSDHPLSGVGVGGVGVGGVGVGGPDDLHSRLAGEAALDVFLAAEIVVIGAPMYNFTVPTQLKAWLDRILIPGRTFRYSPAGPEGLMGGKRVIVAAAAGGFYGAGTPHAPAEHVRSYLGAVFAIIGITPQFIVAEGVHRGAEQRQMALNNARSAISALQPA